MTCRSKIELVRIPSTEQAKIRQVVDDGTQMKAQYEHVRTCDYATYNHVASRLRSNGSAQSNILKLATKSCDNIFARQMRRVESPFIWRDTTRSEEQLFPPRQTSARFFSRSRLAALLKKLSPRPRRSKSQTCPWVVIEFTDTKTRSPNHLSPADVRLEERSASVESDKSFEMAVELNKQRLKNASGPDLSRSKLIVSSGIMPTIITPTILIASPEKTNYRKHENKYVKSRKHRTNSGGTSCKPDQFTVASRPHTLLLPPGGEPREHSATVRRRMASYESIGSCSLDVDVTASDSASELCDSGSVSERTLHSLTLSARTPGTSTPEYVKRTAQLFESTQRSSAGSPKSFPSSPSDNLEDLGKENYPDKSNVRVVLPHQNLNTLQVRDLCNNTEILYNGSKDSGEVTKKPSYLGLACSISGYTTITNYDSKLREGFRSRDHSPGRLVIRSREVSPIRLNQDQIDDANLRFKSDCGNYLAPPRPIEKSNRSDNSTKGDALRNDQKLDVRTLKNSLIVNGALKADLKMSGSSDDNLVTSGTTLRESSRNFMSTMLSTNTYTSSSYEVTSSFQSPGSNYESPTKNKFKNGFQGDLTLDSNVSMSNHTNGSSKPGNFKGFEELTLPEGCPQKRSPGAVRVVEFTSQTKSYVQNGQSAPPTKSSTYSSSKFTDSKNQFLESRPQSTFANSKSNPSQPKSQFSEQKSELSKLMETKPQQLEQKTVTHDVVLTESRSFLNSNVGSETTSIWTGTPSNKSFIQQRVERLYGPGALAQGFFRRTSSSQLRPSQSSYQGGHESSSHGSQAALPVLRHLRPEFRAQLSLGSRKESKNKENQVVKIIPVELDNEPLAEKIFPVEERKTLPILQPQISVESISEHLPAAPEVVLPPQQVTTPIVQSEASVVKDGCYFLVVLRQEIEQLNKMVEDMEQNMESGEDIPEEVSGQLRAATGQGRLLVKQKLQQFEGLCHKNMAQDPEEQFPTTCEDLAGFWDMVKLQVDQVHGLFAYLDRLKAAGWNEEKLLQTDEVDRPQRNSSPKKRPGGPSKRVSKTTTPSVNEEARKVREEARRKLMEEKRRQMREKSKQAPEDVVEIFVPQENGK